jgi:hypothetical protein
MLERVKRHPREKLRISQMVAPALVAKLERRLAGGG